MAAFKHEGGQVVINLALPSDPSYSLPDEARSVQSLGMTCIVQFDRPTRENLEMFFKVLQENRGKKLWIHCVANMPVSAFPGLFWHIQSGWSRENTFQLMHAVWKPNETGTASSTMRKSISPY